MKERKHHQASKGQEILLEPRTQLSHMGQKLSLGKWVLLPQQRGTQRRLSLIKLRPNSLLDLKLPRNLENRLCLEDRVSKPKAA